MDHNLNWYAAKTRANQEFSVSRRFSDLSINTYIPTKQVDSKTQPILPNIVFVHTDKISAYEAINRYGLKIKYMVDAITKKALIVPDKQMRDFMTVMDNYNEESVMLSSDFDLSPGDLVKITSGPFSEVEGIFYEGNKNNIVIRVTGIATISIELNKNTIEKINHHE